MSGITSLIFKRQKIALRQLCYLHKVLSRKLRTYFYELIPPIINSHRNPGCYRALHCRTDLFRNSLLPFSINKCVKLDPDIRHLDSYTMFRKKLFIRPFEKGIYNIYDPQGSKLLNRIGLGFSHLQEHKFQHNFEDTVNPLCSWALEIESTYHFFLRCQSYASILTALINELSSIDCGIVCLRTNTVLEVILHGDKMLNDKSNYRILTATINYIS